MIALQKLLDNLNNRARLISYKGADMKIYVFELQDEGQYLAIGEVDQRGCIK